MPPPNRVTATVLLTAALALYLFLSASLNKDTDFTCPVCSTYGMVSVELGALSMRRVRVANVSFFVWDTPVVDWVMTGGGGEAKVMHALVSLLRANGSSGDVLDIGANTGIYGLVAASHGFNAFLFDYQPQCQEWQRAAIVINHLEHLAHVVPHALGRTDNLTLRVSPQIPCVGHLRASTAYTFHQQVEGLDPRSFYNITTKRLDDLYTGERVLLVKIDTEGFEAEVISGMTRLLREKRIANILMECSPVIWREFRMDRRRVAEEIAGLWDAGFTDVTFFRNQQEAGEDMHFANRSHFLDTLQRGNFEQNDVYLRLNT